MPLRRLVLAALAVWAVTACSSGSPRSPAVTASAPALPAGERRIVTSDGVALYAKVSGRGPVCLFVHGGPGQGALSFEKMKGDALESFVTMVYLDQRGSGKSQTAQDYGLERVVLDLEEVRQALGQERLCLIAHSFGGILAVRYAERYSAHVSALVLANATLQFLSPAQARMQVDFASALLGKQVAIVGPDADAASLEAARRAARQAVMESGNGYRFLTQHVETIQAMSAIDGSYERAREYGTYVIEHRAEAPEYYADHAPRSRAITAPVLVITGRSDFAVGPDEYKRFQFPRQTTVVLDSGHLPYYDESAAFTAAIHRFVETLR